jgi:hypothetical protein
MRKLRLCASELENGGKKDPADFGGADGIRTHDLLDAIEARSQLRHSPTDVLFKC